VGSSVFLFSLRTCFFPLAQTAHPHTTNRKPFALVGRAEEERKKGEGAEEPEGCVASRFPHILTVIYSCKIDLVRHLQG